MKVIGYLTEENDKLFDVDTMKRLAGTSRSKIHRELRKQDDLRHLKHNNKYLYSQRVLFTVLESILIEKLYTDNELRGYK